MPAEATRPGLAPLGEGTDERGEASEACKRLPAEPDDRTAYERRRDALFLFLARPFWARIALVHLLCIVGDGAFFFFLMVNWQAMCTPVDGECEPRDWWLNLSLQILNGLFTYGVLITSPWRAANAVHLSCSPRTTAAGYDMNGRPTEAIWFFIPRARRRAIIALLLGNTLGQIANQATRIVYNSYEAAETWPGVLWVNLFFAQNMACAATAGALQWYEESRLRKACPNNFPPGPVAYFREWIRTSDWLAGWRVRRMLGARLGARSRTSNL